MPQRHRIWLVPSAMSACLALSLLAGGCRGSESLRKVDRRVEDLIRTRSGDLSRTAEATAYEDTVWTTDPSAMRATRIDERLPETNDPDAEDLSYEPSLGTAESEALAVADRLEQYAGLITASPEGARRLDLIGALGVALNSSRELEIAREDYILAAIQTLLARRVFTPRLFNDVSADFVGDGDDGRFDQTLELMNELGVTRNLESGGRVAASWIVRSTEDLRTGVQESTSASELVLSGSIPLLRGAGRVARENVIQAERDLVYAARSFERFRRQLLVSIASDYFGLLESQASIRNQERQLASFRALAEQTRARVDAGRLEDFQVAIAANQVLQAQASLANLRESYILALDAFKIRLGIPLGEPTIIEPVVIDIPAPRATLAAAVDAALAYRLDLQTTRDQIGDAVRGVENAENGLLPDLGLDASVSLPTDNEPPGRRGLQLEPEELRYNIGLTLGLPLDRDDERLAVRQSQISLERARRTYSLARDNTVLDARRAVRNIDLARFQLRLAEEQVRINERRVLGQQLNIDEIEPQTLVDTQNDLIAAENARDAAVTDLRVAILNYLLDTGQMRVGDDGTLVPLSGLVIRRLEMGAQDDAGTTDAMDGLDGDAPDGGGADNELEAPAIVDDAAPLPGADSPEAPAERAGEEAGEGADEGAGGG